MYILTGIPLSNTVIYLLDGDFRPVKQGEIGEIFVSGLNLAEGYVNGRDPEKFVENPLAVEFSKFKVTQTRIKNSKRFFSHRILTSLSHRRLRLLT